MANSFDRSKRPSASSVVVGVMGDPVSHSLSPLLHNTAFGALGINWVSVGFLVSSGNAPGALDGMRALGIAGMSVTMPHKSQVAALVDEKSEVARVLGAVNCVIRKGDRLVGTNTDGQGFLESLKRGARCEVAGMACLVLGAGGASRAVVHALGMAGAKEVVVWARNSERAGAAASLAGGRGRIGSLEEASKMDLVVNATPAGMRGTQSAQIMPPVDPRLLGSGQVVADLIYEPTVTEWLEAASSRGAVILGGLGMLVHQAAAQLEAWTGLEAPLAAMWEAAERAV